MNVLSLFDGISCGQVALNRLGIKYDNYYASEIDKYAIKITQKNYPDTIQIGDITQVKAEDLPKIDLLIGGSPCQGFSFAGKQLNFDDPRSKLFFEYARLLKELKPKWFLLENVIMDMKSCEVISKTLSVTPVMINSALVSAQNRERLYWTNIEGDGENLFGNEISQPEDRGILLRDVLECGSNDMYASRGRYIVDGKRDERKSIAGLSKQRAEKRVGHKSNTLTTVAKDNIVLIEDPDMVETKNYVQFDVSGKGYKSQQDRAYYPDGKFGTLPSARASTKRKIYLGDRCYRNLTLNEYERLQTIEDNYTLLDKRYSLDKSMSAIGNGWTIEVICHILKGIKNLTITPLNNALSTPPRHDRDIKG